LAEEILSFIISFDEIQKMPRHISALRPFDKLRDIVLWAMAERPGFLSWRSQAKSRSFLAGEPTFVFTIKEVLALTTAYPVPPKAGDFSQLGNGDFLFREVK
jgi:hypothetical protein